VLIGLIGRLGTTLVHTCLPSGAICLSATLEDPFVALLLGCLYFVFASANTSCAEAQPQKAVTSHFAMQLTHCCLMHHVNVIINVIILACYKPAFFVGVILLLEGPLAFINLPCSGCHADSIWGLAGGHGGRSVAGQATGGVGPDAPAHHIAQCLPTGLPFAHALCLCPVWQAAQRAEAEQPFPF